jgi:type 1 fimbria pilin
VKDCPSTVTKVSVLFDGTRDTNNSDLLAINGTASGVAINCMKMISQRRLISAQSHAAQRYRWRERAATGTAIWNSLLTMSQPARFPPVRPTVRQTSIWFTTNTLKAGKAAVIHGFPC